MVGLSFQIRTEVVVVEKTEVVVVDQILVVDQIHLV